MSDLNNWRLEYPGVAFDFGNLSTTHPFKVQVDVGAPGLTTQDATHPTSDGRIMGIDSFDGFDLTFALTTLPDGTAKPYMSAMDKISSFTAKWRADSIRSEPGAYASLANLERQRMVWGRPRQVAPKYARIRQGLGEYIATFTTNDPNFYDTTEKIYLITPIPPAGGGFTVPLSPPFSTVAGSAELSPLIANDGELATWPIITFHGPGNKPSIEFMQGANVLWNLRIDDQIKYDETLVVDTRPWSRSATINGKPANGLLRGTQMEKCQIPVGNNFRLRYKVKDKTGNSFVDVKWRDAFASL